jgi:hypothetical protein
MLHINRFLDRLQQCESRRQRDIVLTLAEARDLHTDITKLLLAMEDLRERQNAAATGITEIQVEGGSF